MTAHSERSPTAKLLELVAWPALLGSLIVTKGTSGSSVMFQAIAAILFFALSLTYIVVAARIWYILLIVAVLVALAFSISYRQ